MARNRNVGLDKYHTAEFAKLFPGCLSYYEAIKVQSNAAVPDMALKLHELARQCGYVNLGGAHVICEEEAKRSVIQLMCDTLISRFNRQAYDRALLAMSYRFALASLGTIQHYIDMIKIEVDESKVISYLRQHGISTEENVDIMSRVNYPDESIQKVFMAMSDDKIISEVLKLHGMEGTGVIAGNLMRDHALLYNQWRAACNQRIEVLAPVEEEEKQGASSAPPARNWRHELDAKQQARESQAALERRTMEIQRSLAIAQEEVRKKAIRAQKEAQVIAAYKAHAAAKKARAAELESEVGLVVSRESPALRPGVLKPMACIALGHVILATNVAIITRDDPKTKHVMNDLLIFSSSFYALKLMGANSYTIIRNHLIPGVRSMIAMVRMGGMLHSRTEKLSKH